MPPASRLSDSELEPFVVGGTPQPWQGRYNSPSVFHSEDHQPQRPASYQSISYQDTTKPADSHAHFGLFAGYCFSLNYILGVGILNIPFAFTKAGYVVGPLALAFMTFVGSMSVTWVCDTMARAEGLKRALHTASQSLLVQKNGPADVSLESDFLEQHHHPGKHQQISADLRALHCVSERKFEMNQLCRMFIGQRGQRAYEFCIYLYLTGALWSYAAVFAQSLAKTMPVSFLNAGATCDVSTDPSAACHELYLFYLACFALVCIPLTCCELTEQKPLQITLAIFRYLVIIVMLGSTWHAMWNYPADQWAGKHHDHDGHAPFLSSSSKPADWGSFMAVVPAAVYSQIFQHSIPGLSQPIGRKDKLFRVFLSVLASTLVLYTLLGVSLSVYFGSSIEATCTLSWANYTGGAASKAARSGWATFIAYFVVLFPPLDLLSAFPLNGVTLGNNLLCAFVPHRIHERKVRIFFRICVVALPLTGAAFVSNLSQIVNYSGAVGLFIAFGFPAILAWKSAQKCKQLSGLEDAHVTPFTTRFIGTPWIVFAVVFSVIAFVTVIVSNITGGF